MDCFRSNPLWIVFVRTVFVRFGAILACSTKIFEELAL